MRPKTQASPRRHRRLPATGGSARSLGLLLGFVADRVFGDPRRHHPVAWFGAAATSLERHTYRDARAAGVVHVSLLVGSAWVVGRLIERTASGPVGTAATAAVATWTVVGGRSLSREADAIHGQLLADDLPAARRQLTHLVGRDTSRLDADEIARATVESVAENTSDAVVAPLVAGAVAGVPGFLAYRAANTLDAMIGHRSTRYERFGWAAARLDDVLNLVPSRLAALLAAAASDRPAAALRAWRRDAAGHPSPNAGPVEASFAGALGVRLGGTNHYSYGAEHPLIEHRVEMGDGPPPTVADIPRTTRLAERVGIAAAALAVLINCRFLPRDLRRNR